MISESRRRRLPAPLVAAALALTVLLAAGCRSLTGPASIPDGYYVSSRDWSLDLPDTLIDTTGVHDVRWTRRFRTAREERYLRRAESLYPGSARVPAGDGTYEDQWWLAAFDGIQVAKIPTRGAAAYFRDVVSRFQDGDFTGTIPMQSSLLQYVASIERRAAAEIGGRTYRNVYVAEIGLAWSQYCGNLCAMGFDRRRTVVFDSHGRVIQVIDPEFHGYWVS